MDKQNDLKNILTVLFHIYADSTLANRHILRSIIRDFQSKTPILRNFYDKLLEHLIKKYGT